MVTHIYNKVVTGVVSFLFPLSAFLLTGCADLDYTEETTRDEAWTYEYFENGIKNLVFDVYAQVYNNEFEANSAYFLFFYSSRVYQSSYGRYYGLSARCVSGS